MNLRVFLYSLIAIAITAVIAISVLFATVFERNLSCHTAKESPEDPSLRIAGGEEAILGEYPFVVSIQYTRNHRCGGALISLKYVLTAANCIEDFNETDVQFEAVVGTIELPGFIRHQIQKITRHPDFTSDPALRANIAVAQLVKNVRLEPGKVQPILLPSMSMNDNTELNLYYGRELDISGFGAAKLDGWASPYLKRFTASICACPYEIRHGEHFCSISFYGTSSCSGDAGSPVTTDNKHTVIGIVSHHAATYCGDGKDVHTNVDYYIDWIRSVMKEH